MKHARIHTPTGFRADGAKAEPRDTSGPVLHLLPRLIIKPEILAALPAPRVTCTVRILYPATRWQMPLDGLVVRQPLPNPCYLVAGTSDSRFGFMCRCRPHCPKRSSFSSSGALPMLWRPRSCVVKTGTTRLWSITCSA